MAALKRRIRSHLKFPLLAASLIAADFSDLKREIDILQRSGIGCIHIDVMDGQFVPNLGIGPQTVKCINRFVRVPISCHFMVQEPGKWIAPFADAGADLITVHAESTIHLHRILKQIRDAGCEAGVSLNPSTPQVEIEEVLDIIDVVLIMGVDPGFSGQKFIESTYSKVKRIADARNGRDFMIAVDGGVKRREVKRLVIAGADILVIGSGIFDASEPRKAVIDFMSEATMH